MLMDDERPAYRLAPDRIDGPGVMSRRAALIGIGSATAALLGVVADRTLFGGTSMPSPTDSPTGSPTPSNDRLAVNLRPVKPYDWVDHPFAGLGGRKPGIGSVREFVWSLAFEGEDLAVPANSVEVLAVASPAAIGEITDVSLTMPLPMPIERLRDMGLPSDLAAIEAANGMPPTVGDLWVLLPRDRPWPAGKYTVTAKTATRLFVFSFQLVD